MTVVTRFAPSPTGFLHIGGARTALFNWLYARGRGGKMLLRIEDTDRERSTQAAIDAILDGLNWLGIAWDGEAIYQFARAARHRKSSQALLAVRTRLSLLCEPGRAYADARGGAARRPRQALRRPLARPRSERGAAGPSSPRSGSRRRSPAKPSSRIRSRAASSGRTRTSTISCCCAPTARRPTCSPLSSTITIWRVTHVIRGDDHLTNAARQKQIYDALGWTVPVMAHIPLIHGPDGSKLSKRHGALGVDAYRAMGYLPEALRNYLVRLGWSHGDQEIFSTEEMIAAFDLPQIGRSPARFDFAKLESLNGHYIRQSDDAELVAAIGRLLPHIADGAALAEKLTPGVRASFFWRCRA